ncbi:MAG: hypothetical protein AMXMBFR47_17540 [Planctomycetota bacterium]
MIHETVIDRAINRLLAHFGPRVVLRPPASAADLGTLEARAGSLPRDYGLYLMTCNGLRVSVAQEPGAFQLCGVHEALEAGRTPQTPAIPEGFIPLCNHVDGSTDWLVLSEDALQGAVLRWTPGMHGEELLASSFGHYFDNWTTWLKEMFDRDGRRASTKSPLFDAAYCSTTDPAITRLARTRGVRDSIAELELRAAAGEDFE